MFLKDVFINDYNKEKKNLKNFLKTHKSEKICNRVVQNYPVLMWYKKQTKEKQ